MGYLTEAIRIIIMSVRHFLSNLIDTIISESVNSSVKVWCCDGHDLSEHGDVEIRRYRIL